MAELAPKVYEIKIKDMEFEPPTCNIKQGDRVYWTNLETAGMHNATAKDKSFNCGDLPSGGWKSGQYQVAKTTEYGCRFHPGMKGVVKVE